MRPEEVACRDHRVQTDIAAFPDHHLHLEAVMSVLNALAAKVVLVHLYVIIQEDLVRHYHRLENYRKSLDHFLRYGKSPRQEVGRISHTMANMIQKIDDHFPRKGSLDRHSIELAIQETVIIIHVTETGTNSSYPIQILHLEVRRKRKSGLVQSQNRQWWIENLKKNPRLRTLIRPLTRRRISTTLVQKTFYSYLTTKVI
jgi:hypothetical protein